MKREAKLLHQKSLESLVLSIEHFNRPTDTGRSEAVLVLLDRAFELLLKAAIIHKGGKIREPRARETIGFDKCVRKCLTDAKVACLSEEQAITVQIINSLRDAAQHYLVDVSEPQLYMYAQAGVTLYGEVQESVFGVKLRDQLPSRVLPVTTAPPHSLASLIDAEFGEVKDLLKPGSRHRLEAKARLRSLSIIEASLGGVRAQPGEGDLNRLVRGVKKGTRWQDLFPGVATLRLDTEGTGLNVTIRLTKSEGEPVRLVPEGTPGATVVAVKRVDELGWYSLNLTQLAQKLGLTAPKALALIQHQGIQKEGECYKAIAIGKAVYKRYSPTALDRLKKAQEAVDMDEIWKKHRPGKRRA